jgi:tripartite-type tricarboxylate transporter receptor subunit TctC
MACAVLITVAPAALAQDWPNRSMLVISTVSAGNAGDTIARIVLDQVSKQIDQSFVIENRTGAGGTIGSASVAKADPDGYTIVLLTSSQGSALVLHKTLPYDPLRDFVPVAMFGVQPSVLVAAPSKDWKSVTDLVAAAKAKPGALNFASAGLGSASHWAAERLRLAAGINVQHIPFRGPVEAFTEVMTGRVDFYYLPIAPALPNIRDGKVVALAVSTLKRAPTLPNVSTVVEAGYPDAQYLFWGGLAFPAKTPRAIVDRLHAETQKALAVPAVQDRLATFGVEPMPMTVDEFGKFYRDDVMAIVKLAKDINLVPRRRLMNSAYCGTASQNVLVASFSAHGTILTQYGGQSGSALPGYFRHQLVPLLRAHRRPRSRDT